MPDLSNIESNFTNTLKEVQPTEIQVSIGSPIDYKAAVVTVAGEGGGANFNTGIN